MDDAKDWDWDLNWDSRLLRLMRKHSRLPLVDAMKARMFLVVVIACMDLGHLEERLTVVIVKVLGRSFG